MLGTGKALEYPRVQENDSNLKLPFVSLPQLQELDNQMLRVFRDGNVLLCQADPNAATC